MPKMLLLLLFELVASLIEPLWLYKNNLHLRVAKKIRNGILVAGLLVIAIFAIGIWLTVE